MSRRRKSYTREFKKEAVKLVTEQGYKPDQVARDPGITTNMLGRWRRELTGDLDHAFPGKGRLKEPEEEIRQLRREAERLWLERDILKKQSVSSRKARSEIPGHRKIPKPVRRADNVPGPGRLSQRLLCLERAAREQPGSTEPRLLTLIRVAHFRKPRHLWQPPDPRRTGGKGREVHKEPGGPADAGERDQGQAETAL